MKKKEPKGEVFEGRTSEMKDSPWLASEDLMGLGDVPVTIEKCLRHKNVEFDKGRVEDTVFTLVLAGKKKQLVLAVSFLLNIPMTTYLANKILLLLFQDC